MKMNRSRSSDSLDNGIGDVISSSSSSTDFTSDDELNDLYILSGRSMKGKLKPEKAVGSNGQHQTIIGNKLSQQNQTSYYQANPLGSTRHNTCVSAERLHYGTNANLRNFENLYSNRLEHETGSYYGEIENSNLDDLLYTNRMPEQPLEQIVSPEAYASLDGGSRQANSTTTNPPLRAHTSNRRVASTSQNRANTGTTDTDQNCFASSSNYNDYGLMRSRTNFDANEDDDENEDLFRRPDLRIIDPHIPTIAGPSRQLNHTVAAMCARLVECRNLGDMIDFVGSNRDLIDNLTRVIRDAPAYRNYDMSSYQIDYSVKESFNPEFWQDREPIVTTADGNCQYHAVSLSLTGSEMYTQEVRLLTALAVVDNRDWFDSILKIIDGGTVVDLVHTIARAYSWGDATTLKAIAVAIRRRIFLYTCNIGKKDYEMVKMLGKDELLDAFREKKYRGGTGIHTYADPLTHVQPNNYIMLFHKSEHFIAVLPKTQNPIMYEPYNPIVPTF